MIACDSGFFEAITAAQLSSMKDSCTLILPFRQQSLEKNHHTGGPREKLKIVQEIAEMLEKLVSLI